MPGSVTSSVWLTVSAYQKGVYGNVFKDYPIFHKVCSLRDFYMTYTKNGIMETFS